MSHKPTTYVGWKPKVSSNAVWKNYVVSPDNKFAKCLRCVSVLTVTGGCTKSLHVHEKCHNKPQASNIDQSNNSSQVKSSACASASTTSNPAFSTSVSSSKRQKLITENFVIRNDSLASVVSRMTALDGMPISKFVTSNDLRSLMAHKGYNLPTTFAPIRQLIYSHADAIKNAMKSEITQLLSKGVRFTLSCDEWTSCRNRRYINLVLHYLKSKTFNLGLIRGLKSLDANNIVSEVILRLQEFNVNVANDVVALMSDGASTMVLVGEILDIEHQLCMSHGLHLAIIKTLYNSSIKDLDISSQSSNDNEKDSELEVDDDDDDDTVGGFVITS